MKAWRGWANQMIGPGLYGYIDAQHFRYGENGGRFVFRNATVDQRPHTEEGEERLPIWSEIETDDIVVACPPDMVFDTVEEGGDGEGLSVWVHRISRDPEHWRHDVHPMSLAEVQGVFLALKEGIKAVVSSESIRLAIPVVDEADGKAKMWSIPSTSKIAQDLIKKGLIRKTPSGAYYIPEKETVEVKEEQTTGIKDMQFTGMGPLSFEDLQKKFS